MSVLLIIVEDRKFHSSESSLSVKSFVIITSVSVFSALILVTFSADLTLLTVITF